MIEFNFNQYLIFYYLSSLGTFETGYYTTPTGEAYTDPLGEPYTY